MCTSQVIKWIRSTTCKMIEASEKSVISFAIEEFWQLQ